FKSLSLIESPNLRQVLSSAVSYFLGGTQIPERFECGLDHVVRVVGPDAFGQHILDARRFYDGANAPAGNHTGSVRGGLQHNISCAELSADLGENGCLGHRDANEILLGLLQPFANSFGPLLGLSHPVTD